MESLNASRQEPLEREKPDFARHKLVLKNIYKTYNTKPVLAIQATEIPLQGLLAIVGWSGSGKSTLLNILSLIDHPDPNPETGVPSLEYHLRNATYVVTYPGTTRPRITRCCNQGEVSLDVGTFRREVFGFVFQEHYLHPNLNIEYNVKMPLLTRGRTVAEADLEKICEPLGISEQMLSHVEEVSGGQAQRAAILRGLLKHCPVVFGDELTSNIDNERARIVLGGLSQMVSSDDDPIECFLWVSHDINLISEYAEMIIVIKKGEINCFANTFQDDANGILGLLREEAHEKVGEDLDGIAQRQSTFSERFHYYASYAYRDLFKKAGRPTVDFSMIVASLVFVILFLLSIFKISYGSSKFLELKLSDPRINSLEVTGTEKVGNELRSSHFAHLVELLTEDVRYLTPIYYVRTSILDIRQDTRYRSLGNAVTFRRGDPVIGDILGNNSAEFVNHEKDFRGLIITKSALERLGYPEDTKQINAKFNGFNDDNDQMIPLIVVDTPLPFNKKMMMREEFYLESYRTLSREELPPMAYVIVYPNNIYDTVAIKDKIEAKGEFEINQAFKVLNKIRIIDEIKKQTGLFVVLSLTAIALMSLLFIGITIYRNLHKKRREIGVFLAFGMPHYSLCLFYLLEAVMISVVAFTLSLVIYLYGAEIIINDMLMRGSITTIANVVDLGTVIEPGQLSIPSLWIISTYLVTFVLLTGLFLGWVNYFALQKPIQLIKES